jgi:hypothetical protein
MWPLLRQSASFQAAIILATVVVSLAHDAVVASDFQNFDFETNSLPPPPGTFLVPSSIGLPYWDNNNYLPGYVAYGTIALDSVCISVHDGHSGYAGDFNPLQGYYSILLQHSSQVAVPPLENAWISQTGDIPPEATSLTFTTEAYCAGHLVVSLNGTEIPMSLYSVGWQVNPNHGALETFIGDIRQFTGQENVELRFTGYGTLDDIEFSPLIVPEPSTLVLFAIGVLSLAGYCWRQRNRAR